MIFEPDAYLGDPYGWLVNQSGHVLWVGLVVFDGGGGGTLNGLPTLKLRVPNNHSLKSTLVG